MIVIIITLVITTTITPVTITVISTSIMTINIKMVIMLTMGTIVITVFFLNIIVTINIDTMVSKHMAVMRILRIIVIIVHKAGFWSLRQRRTSGPRATVGGTPTWRVRSKSPMSMPSLSRMQGSGPCS